MLKRSRYFALGGLIAALIATALAVGGLYRHMAVRSLVEMGEENHTAFAQSMVNPLRPALGGYLAHAAKSHTEVLNRHPALTTLRATIVPQMQQATVIKVKLYDLAGRTIFSTDPGQIGDDGRVNAAFQSARSERPASELTRHNRIRAFGQVLEKRDLLSTYVPLRFSAAEPIQAVIEVISDVTPFVQRIARMQWLFSSAVLTALLLLYAGLYAVTAHSERTLRRQYAEREASQVAEIHERRLAEARASYLAHHDALTGLPNRALFMDRLKQAVARAVRNGTMVAVLYVDLDRFKVINDTLGHATGDEVLKLVGALCSKDLREMDTVARLGGDEFIIFLGDVRSIEEAGSVAKRLLSDIARGFEIGGRKQYANASVGISLFPGDGRDADTLVHNADAAMYHAKSDGRGTFHFFQPRMTERVMRRLSLEIDLRGALDRQELLLHFQPVFELRSGELVGAEALVRWNHPGRGLVSPTEFIPVAEDIGLIVRLGEWVLNEACAQAVRWATTENGTPFIAVNLSTRQLHEGSLVTTVKNALARSGIPANRLELEFADAGLIQRSETSTRTLQDLGALGVKLAIDDFGSGYSSISFLKRFPVSTLKIERSFLYNVIHDEDDRAIIMAIMATARTFGLTVTAKGVERMDQVTFLSGLGCDQVQGYLYGRPGPAEEFERFIRKRGGAGLSIIGESTGSV